MNIEDFKKIIYQTVFNEEGKECYQFEKIQWENGDFWDYDYRKIDEENSKFKLALEEQEGNYIFKIFSFIYNGKEYCFKCTGEYISIREYEVEWLSFKQVFPYTTTIVKYSDSEN